MNTVSNIANTNRRSLMHRIGLQFFAEDPPVPPAEPNYDELIKADKTLQAFLDSRITKATQTAISNYVSKQAKLTDDKISEAEKLKSMSDGEKVEYFKKKYESSEAEKQKYRNSEALKEQTSKMLGESGIPTEFLSQFDFMSADADSVKSKVDFLGKYEIYSKGTFESKLNEALNAKLKQEPPKTGGAGGDDAKMRSYFGLPPTK